MNKKVIYSALVGNYDNIHQPIAINPDFDYIIFSNDISEDKIGVWQIRKIPYDNEDKTKIARWVKTHPEQLLSEYEISVWTDGNVQITGTSFYDRIKELQEKNILISSMWHNTRDCIYTEAAAATRYMLDDEKTVIKWIKKIVKEGYPIHNGLFETNTIYRLHNNNSIKELDLLWWQCIEHYSRRDQLSFNYVLWRLKIECPYFLSDSQNTRNSDCVKKLNHDNAKNRLIQRNIKKNAFISYYPYRNLEKISYIYRKIARMPFSYQILICLGQYYRIKSKITSMILRFHF